MKFSFSFCALGAVTLFLYAPIVYVVVFSFNDSPLMNTWQGFSLRWYRALFQDPPLIKALFVSLQVALMSATFSVVLGILCASFLVRTPGMKWQKAWVGVVVKSPLVIPEIIIGLAFLIFFVALENLCGWPWGRGIATITIAHTTMALSYVTVIIRTRLQEVDRALEEGALDLGAKPYQVFYCIVLPQIYPSLLSAWLLAFTLSLDDLVIASFTSGPGSSTLPMAIFSCIRMGVTPQINALATIIILAVVISVSSGFYALKHNLKVNQ